MRGGPFAVLALVGAVAAGLPIVMKASALEPGAGTRMAALDVPPPRPDHAARSLPTSIDYGPLPAELMAPVPQCPTDLKAPSDAAWVRSTMRLSYYSERFVLGLRPSIAPDLADAPMPRAKPDERRKRVAAVPLPPLRPSIDGADIRAAAVSEAPLPETAAKPIDTRPLTSRQRKSAERGPPEIEALIASHSARFGIPERLVRRVVWRESKYDPKARNGPYWGLMQISVPTARSLGFRGAPSELLDADTNMTFAVAYLANAYRVAGRNEDRAVSLYARGYYYEAKRKGLLGDLIKTASVQ